MAFSLILLPLFHPTKCLPTSQGKKIQTVSLVNSTGRDKATEKKRETGLTDGAESFATM